MPGILDEKKKKKIDHYSSECGKGAKNIEVACYQKACGIPTKACIWGHVPHVPGHIRSRNLYHGIDQNDTSPKKRRICLQMPKILPRQVLQK